MDLSGLLWARWELAELCNGLARGPGCRVMQLMPDFSVVGRKCTLLQAVAQQRVGGIANLPAGPRRSNLPPPSQ